MHYKYLFAFLTLLWCAPLAVGATGYQPLVGVPGISGTGSIEAYINTLYALSISVAALIAVIKIIVAGVKYMLSDVVTSKGAAIKDIQGALLGLIVVVMAWLILFVINPNIVSIDAQFEPVSTPTTAPIIGGNLAGDPFLERLQRVNSGSLISRESCPRTYGQIDCVELVNSCRRGSLLTDQTVGVPYESDGNIYCVSTGNRVSSCGAGEELLVYSQPLSRPIISRCAQVCPSGKSRTTRPNIVAGQGTTYTHSCE